MTKSKLSRTYENVLIVYLVSSQDVASSEHMSFSAQGVELSSDIYVAPSVLYNRDLAKTSSLYQIVLIVYLVSSQDVESSQHTSFWAQGVELSCEVRCCI